MSSLFSSTQIQSKYIICIYEPTNDIKTVKISNFPILQLGTVASHILLFTKNNLSDKSLEMLIANTTVLFVAQPDIQVTPRFKTGRRD